MSENLILKYLSGRLSEEEAKRLHDWVSESEHNKKYFARIKNAWVASGTANADASSINLRKETDLFNYRRTLQKETQNHSLKIKTISAGKKSVINSFLKVAAVLLLFYSLGLTMYSFFIPDKVQFSEVITKNGEKSQVTLADGSKIWLNSNSKVRYPVNMDDKNVQIYLEGEAFFDINKIPGRKIVVNTSELKINVLGTAFNVKSYSDDGITETTLVRGKITIDGQQKKLKQQLILQPNQQATYVSSSESLVVKNMDEGSTEELAIQVEPEETEKDEVIQRKEPTSKMILTEKVDTDLYTSWKDGKLVFKSERFEDLAKRMERWFDVKIEIKNEKLKDSRYTGTFEKESIEQALKALSLSLPFQFQIDQNKIIILEN